MSTFRPGKYLVIAPVKCIILQDISLFKIGDINLIAIQTIFSSFQNRDLFEPSFDLVREQERRPFTSTFVGEDKNSGLQLAFAVKF